MIVTVTVNPALDKTMILKKVSMGEVNRVETVRNDMGGKGINVSKVLKSLGEPSLATGFLGGILEEVFRKELKQLGIEDQFLSVSGDTRTNLKIVDEGRKKYTDFNEPGPEITEKELALFHERFKSLLFEGDLLVLSGGLCKGLPKDLYAILMKEAKSRGVKVLLDAEGEALTYGIQEKPFLLKPNEQELAGYLKKETLKREELLEAGQKLLEEGIPLVLVSRGEKGSVLFSQEGIFESKGLKVSVKSTVGAGDAMVGAAAYGLRKGYGAKKLLAFAEASGAAAVAKEGTQAPSKEEIDHYYIEALEQIEEVL